MDALEQLLSQTRQVATDHGMHAYLVGSKVWVAPSYDHDGYFDDGRLYKICPAGFPSCPLLEVELDVSLRIYKHRNNELTSTYKGRRISIAWVANFIDANAALAADIVANPPIIPEPPKPNPPIPLSPEEADAMHNERNVVLCCCGGTSEHCVRCFGSGFYTVDGFGNRV